MSKLEIIPLDRVAYPVAPSGINDRNSVSNGPDNGANDNMGKLFWKCKRHGTTTAAADKLLIPVALSDADIPEAMRGTGACNIGGHGNEGLVETGTGQSGPFNVQKLIYLWSEHVWGPQLERLRDTPAPHLFIWACHTGAGQDGADLLFAMAKRFGRAVKAGTGLLYTNGQKIWWENGTQIQVATPNHKPSPIAAPTPHLVMDSDLAFSVNDKVYLAGNITEMALSPSAFGVRQAAKSVKGSAAATIARALFVSSAIDLGAEVMGMVTAQIRLTFDDGATLDLDVYNHRMAVTSTSRLGYYLSGGFRTLLDTLDAS